MDIQECPHADLAIASLVIALIKALASERLVDREAQMKWKTDALAELLDRTSAEGGDAHIDNVEFLELLSFRQLASLRW